MNILIAGGSGFIGQALAKSFTDEEHLVTILSRSKRESKNRYLTYLQWNGKEMPQGIGLYDVIINLSGVGIGDKRWSEAYKFKLKESRINSTQACVNYINRSPRPPKIFVNASGVGFYGGSNMEKLDEAGAPGHDFLGKLSQEWEEVAAKAQVRTVMTRFGLVLGNDGGIFPLIAAAYNFFLGGQFASGKQGYAWIHIEDVVGAIKFCIEQESIEGPVNFVGPELVNQKTFSRKLAKSLNRPDIWIVPKFFLQLVLGERSVLLWGGQYAVPGKLSRHNYPYKFPTLSEAFEDLA